MTAIAREHSTECGKGAPRKLALSDDILMSIEKPVRSSTPAPIRAAAPKRTIAMNSRTSQSQKGSSPGGSPMPPISPEGISAGAISATSSEWEPRENRKRRNFSNRSPMGLRIPASHSNCVLSTRMPIPARVL